MPNGVCNFCKIQDALEADSQLNEQNQARFRALIEKIKHEGRHKEYDCVVGVSGGRDSTFVLYNALKLGLRPLAVHFDNGWNSEIAVANIKKATNKLNVDLHTVVADWEEFKDLQKSFLRASVSDAEIPTDYAILSVLYKEAAHAGTRYILNGHSFRTEGIVPLGWTYMDGRYVHSVHKKFGRMRIRSFPIMSMADLIYYTSVRRITFVNMLKYIEYDHKKAGGDHEPGAGLAILRRPPPRERLHPLLPVLPVAEEVRHRQAEDRVLGAHPLRPDGPGRRRSPTSRSRTPSTRKS